VIFTSENLLRELAPQVLGAVIRRYGDFAAAEDAVQEALLAAAMQWPREGVPDNPRGWLIHVAGRRMTDHIRAELARRRRETARTSAIALTLRAVGGLTTAEIANAFLVPEATMAQRISRANQKIKTSGVPFRLPTDRERAERLDAVLHVLYLIFNEGYTSSMGPHYWR
jgi:predicted RNA polymerase sigma factor